MEELHVVGVRQPEDLRSHVEFNPYVPFRFRTAQRPMGASFVRFGDRKRTLLELAVDPASQVLTGVTLTSVGSLEAGQVPPLERVERGLPVLATTFTSGAQVTNVGRDFHVNVGPEGLVVHWQEFASPVTALEWGRVSFLISHGSLVGFWCRTLTAEERGHFEEAARC